MRIFRDLFLAFFILFATHIAASAQTHSADPLRTMLSALRAESMDFTASLPSISCDESIRVTSPVFLSARKVIEASAEMRVRRDSDSSLPKEARQFTSLNGRSFPAIERVSLPMLLNGGFVEGLKVFLSADVASCMTYALGAVGKGPMGSTRISFARNAKATKRQCTRVMPGLTGYALVAPDGEHVQHVERTIAAELATLNHVAAFTAVDYAPVALGDASFWLPAHVSSYTGQKEITWEASYHGCRRYAVTATILPLASVLLSGEKSSTQVASVE